MLVLVRASNKVYDQQLFGTSVRKFVYHTIYDQFSKLTLKLTHTHSFFLEIVRFFCLQPWLRCMIWQNLGRKCIHTKPHRSTFSSHWNMRKCWTITVRNPYRRAFCWLVRIEKAFNAIEKEERDGPKSMTQSQFHDGFFRRLACCYEMENANSLREEEESAFAERKHKWQILAILEKIHCKINVYVHFFPVGECCCFVALV